MTSQRVKDLALTRKSLTPGNDLFYGDKIRFNIQEGGPNSCKMPRKTWTIGNLE